MELLALSVSIVQRSEKNIYSAKIGKKKSKKITKKKQKMSKKLINKKYQEIVKNVR